MVSQHPAGDDDRPPPLPHRHEPPSLPPYEPTRDLGEILAWADSGMTPVKIRNRIARVQRWLRIGRDASADVVVNRLRIMLPAFALALVEQLDADERAEALQQLDADEAGDDG